MKEQLTLLLQLQAADTELRDFDASMVALPARLEPIRRDIAKLEQLLAGEQARIAETETWQREQTALLERENDALKLAKAKLGASRNTKEFAAANREIDNKKKSISDREAEIKKVVAAMAASREQLTQRAGDIEELRRQLAAQEGELGGQIAALKQTAQEALARREQLRGQLPPELLKRYDVAAHKRGTALAHVEKATCRGCNMAVPPQLANVVARMESIENCPRCGRIIYRREMLEAAAAT